VAVSPCLFNHTGHPSVSVPVPFDETPCGMQFVGPRGAHASLLDSAATFEAAVTPMS
jgi:Asp-tRNA(Asn)/Glu-tRNA(Gln) amidotransferase A subunit family amidase